MFTTLISHEELLPRLGDANLIVVDCRFSLADTESGRSEYREGHLPGAFYAHLDEDLSGEIVPGKTGRHPLPQIEQASKTFSLWGIAADKQVVAYDQGHGGIASRLWWMLNWLGHENVAVLDGGWTNWTNNSLPVSSDVPEPSTSTQFTANPRNDWIVSVDDVEAMIGKPDKLIVDSRAAARYRGENEPIDPVAGHVPSAVSSPFVDNVPAGKFQSASEIKARFEPMFGDRALSDIVFYCGSGVTACHNLLAVKHAGLGMAKLFPGSWSEWIVDPNRKVVTET